MCMAIGESYKGMIDKSASDENSGSWCNDLLDCAWNSCGKAKCLCRGKKIIY